MISGKRIRDSLQRDAQPCCWSTKETNDVRFVITLVHGTWAKRAAWLRPDSTMSKMLAQLPGGARICPFIWSGRDSNRARHLASKKLESELACRVKAYPSARHYLICHSHGGNVVMRVGASLL